MVGDVGFIFASLPPRNYTQHRWDEESHSLTKVHEVNHGAPLCEKVFRISYPAHRWNCN